MGLSYIGFGLLELAQIRMSMASRRMQRGKIRIDREPGVRGAEPRRSRGVIDDAELPAIARDSCRAPETVVAPALSACCAAATKCRGSAPASRDGAREAPVLAYGPCACGLSDPLRGKAATSSFDSKPRLSAQKNVQSAITKPPLFGGQLPQAWPYLGG